MGQLIYFCAGTSVDVLPGKHVDALLLNVPNNAENEKRIKASRNLIQVAQPRTVMLDSGGFQLYTAEDDGLQIIYDESAPIYLPGTINLTPWHLIRGAVEIQPDTIVGLTFRSGRSGRRRSRRSSSDTNWDSTRPGQSEAPSSGKNTARA